MTKVTFANSNNPTITMSAVVNFPEDFDASKSYPAVIVSHPGWSAPFEVIHPLCWSADRNGWSQGWPGSVTSPKRS